MHDIQAVKSCWKGRELPYSSWNVYAQKTDICNASTRWLKVDSAPSDDPHHSLRPPLLEPSSALLDVNARESESRFYRHTILVCNKLIYGIGI